MKSSKKGGGDLRQPGELYQYLRPIP